MFIRHKQAGSFQHPPEKRLRDLFLQQALPILALRRVIPHRLVHLHPHEPPEQQVTGSFVSKCSSAMIGDGNDAEVPKIFRYIICSREAIWEVMWKKISSPFASYAIEKSISVLRLLYGSTCDHRTSISVRFYFGPMMRSPLSERSRVSCILSSAMNPARC
jgi:hypothetical protein